MLLHDGHLLAEWLLKLLLLGWHTLLLLSHLVAVHLHILRDALLLLRLGELLLLKLLLLLLLGWHALLLLSHLVAVHLHILRHTLLLLGELLLLKLLLLLLLGWHALLLHLRCVRAGAVLPGRAVSPKRVAKGLLWLAAAWLLLLGGGTERVPLLRGLRWSGKAAAVRNAGANEGVLLLLAHLLLLVYVFTDQFAKR